MPRISSMAWRVLRSVASTPPALSAICECTSSSSVNSFSWWTRMASSFSSSSSSPGFSFSALISVHRVGEKVRAPKTLPLVAHQLGETFPQRRRAPRTGSWNRSRQLLRSRPAVHQRAVVLQVQERLVLVLPVQVEQERGRTRGGPSRVTGVDWMKMEPRPLDFSMRRRMTAPSSGSMPCAASHARRLLVAPRRNDARDGGLLRAGADDGGVGLVARAEARARRRGWTCPRRSPRSGCSGRG